MKLRIKIFAVVVTIPFVLAACSGTGAGQKEPDDLANEPIVLSQNENPGNAESDETITDFDQSGDNQLQEEVESTISPTPSPLFEQDYGPNEISDRDISNYEIITLLPKDRIRAIDDAEYYPVKEANREYSPDELVIGVEFNGDARAYAVSLLSRHEIVNDTVGGIKIAITW